LLVAEPDEEDLTNDASTEDKIEVKGKDSRIVMLASSMEDPGAIVEVAAEAEGNSTVKDDASTAEDGTTEEDVSTNDDGITTEDGATDDDGTPEDDVSTTPDGSTDDDGITDDDEDSVVLLTGSMEDDEPNDDEVSVEEYVGAGVETIMLTTVVTSLSDLVIIAEVVTVVNTQSVAGTVALTVAEPVQDEVGVLTMIPTDSVTSLAPNIVEVVVTVLNAQSVAGIVLVTELFEIVTVV
jgi:hypothetical protein